jgi:hypothetical protein
VKLTRREVVIGGGALAVVGGIACCPTWQGYDEVTGEARQLAPGKMPEGHAFAGTWWSPQFGSFTLTETAPGKLSGELKWDSQVQDAGACALSRTLTGEAKGNQLVFTWSETLPAGCGASRQGHGRLFFGLSADEGRLFAAWWLNDDEGHSENWTAFSRS